VSAVLGLGLAALGPVSAANAAVPHATSPGVGTSSSAPHATSPAAQYAAGRGESAQGEQAFLAAVLKKVAQQQAMHPDAPVTLTYEAGDAPTFADQIAQATSIWNSSVTNVQLEQVSSGGDFYFTEGNDPADGSYASTDGHGDGYIFIDYTQAQEYYSTRIVAHEIGHVLGLPDDYSGPCSELMSGHGPGPSCMNATPDAQEIAEVNSLWEDGFGPAAIRLP
jgi:snapalysin